MILGWIENNKGLKMIKALVLVNTELNSQENVLETLKTVEGVEEAHALFGVYDLLVKVKTPSIDKFKNVTKPQIKKASGVTNLLTLILYNSEENIPNSPAPDLLNLFSSPSKI
jgi:DNA-binding Lrp family transcriptional regulator